MNKQQLEQIFSKEYQPALWREVLTDIFGVTNLYQTPEPITLNSNDVAESAFELGSFDTTDDRIIGLYRVDLNDIPNIERNRVELRETLRSVYKYDVDGALVVFVQGDKWRLSFISEIRTLDDEGQIVSQATEPKRYTYLLGRDEKVKTSAIRLASIAGKELSLEDIREAFSVEALNEEFYKIVRDYFYQLVGGTIGKGSRNTTYDKSLELPIADNKENEKYFREFAVRLIGRTIFCWFLKVKKSDAGIPLLPESLLSFEAVNKNSNYYHHILERLFFQTLNTPMDKRRDDLPKGCEIIPFLNGGLFEDQPDDFYDANKGTGINNNLNTLQIPDSWFAEFFEEISHYNFTADENSPVDIEFSIDPEMLGRIFENLLAEIDPDTGESARKATGSFYTPREIVSYMVDESLIYYLKAKLETETKGFGFQAIGETQTDMFGNEGRIQQKFEIPLESNRWQNKPAELEAALRELFSHGKSEHQFNETETEILIKAIDNCKVLDPACGSGAFPIGVLQRLVFLLEKLDKDNKKWEMWQKEKAIEETKKAFEEGDKTQRDARLKEISDAFEKDSSGYGRKLFLIERCIYGVDIQPIAAEISKLRCFLTLVVDDTVDETAENRGVRHLPNLEFKFVTADALLKLPQSSLFNSDTQLAELEKIRTAYLQSYGEKKVNLKAKFKQLQGEILDEQNENFQGGQDERAIKLGGWKPFEHEKTDWFDPLWMFGVKDFDVVIGNPPWVSLKGKHGIDENKRNIDLYLKFYDGNTSMPNLYEYFILNAASILNNNGILAFIVPDRLGNNSSMSYLRKKILNEFVLKEIVYRWKFESVIADTMTILVSKQRKSNYTIKVKYNSKFDWLRIDAETYKKTTNYVFKSYKNRISQHLVKKIKNKSKSLKQFCSSTSGFGGKSSLITSQRLNNNQIEVIKGSCIGRYVVKEKLYFEFKNENLSGRTKDKYKLGKQEKLLLRKTGNTIIATYDNSGIYPEQSLYFLYDFKENISSKYLLAIFNSKLLTWYYLNELVTNIDSTPQLKNYDLDEMPIVIKKDFQKPFENLVDYILFLKDSELAVQINEKLANSHLAEQFEEVIDALVYELYFEEDFQRENIGFIKYAERDFPPIENLELSEKIKTIHAAYQMLMQKDNEIKTNLKLMEIKLADLIMPIKNAN